MDDPRAGGDAAPPTEERVTATTVYRAVLLAFALLVVVLVFPLLASICLLFLLVMLVAVPMSRATDWLQDHLNLPRGIGAPLVLVAAVAVIGALVALLVPIFVSEGNRFVNALPSTVDSLRNTLGRATHAQPSSIGQSTQHWVDGYTSQPQKLLGPATTIGAGLAGLVTTMIVAALTALYTSIRPDPLIRGAVRLVPPSRRDHARHILHRLGDAYLGWLRGLVAGMAVLWVLTYAGLLLIHLPYAVVFATLTALAMVVPYYGALVSSIPPVLLALTISPTMTLLVTALYLLTHQVEGHVIEPLVMARALKLHPALVAIGVLAVERLFGFAGLLVAVPILVTLKILVDELWVRPMEAANDGGPLDEPPPGRTESGERFARLRVTR